MAVSFFIFYFFISICHLLFLIIFGSIATQLIILQLIQEDFFVVLRNMLKSRPEISEILCVKDAKVPLMRFKIEGISIDLPYAQLKVPSVPDVS